jgi:hypothetical protein
MPIPEGVGIPGVAKLLDENKTFQANDLVAAGASKMLDELGRWAGALMPLRSA